MVSKDDIYALVKELQAQGHDLDAAFPQRVSWTLSSSGSGSGTIKTLDEYVTKLVQLYAGRKRIKLRDVADVMFKHLRPQIEHRDIDSARRTIVPDRKVTPADIQAAQEMFSRFVHDLGDWPGAAFGALRDSGYKISSSTLLTLDVPGFVDELTSEWARSEAARDPDALEDLQALLDNAKENWKYTLKDMKDSGAVTFSEPMPLGKVAFPTQRTVSYSNVPYEPNTELEDSLISALKRHFNGTPDMTDEDATSLMSILDSGKYRDVITEPYEKILYRGMWLDPQGFKKIFGSEPDDSDDSGTIEKAMVFKPWKSASSSWTAIGSIARGFAGKRVAQRSTSGYGVVLHAKRDENNNKFIDGDEGLYKLSGIDGYSAEHEVVGLGNINVYKIVWWRK